VRKGSVPPAELLQFPATNLEDELDLAPEREDILRNILAALIELRPLLGSEELIAQWEGLLALRDENVQVESEKNPPVTGQIYGLETDGSLRLRNEHGEFVTVRFGDVRLRPLA
jgi:biotin-(acetyl-CoA carboxylase) ligase